MNKTVQAYNKKAKIYHKETESFWSNFPNLVIDMFTSELMGKRVLNIGSGTGRDSEILRERGLNVVCVDAATEMIKMTKRLGFESVKADFRRLPFPESSFDGVWAYTSLLHVSKQDARDVIKDIRKLLKPKGIFLIGMREGEFEGEVERKGWEGSNRFFIYYTEGELTEMITSCGFKKLYQERYKPSSKTYLNQVYRVL